MRQICRGAALIVVLGLLATPAYADLVPGKVALVKFGKIAKFVSKAPFGLPFTLPVPLGLGDPTLFGGILTMGDTAGGAGGVDVYPLPAAFWTGLGVPPGTKGYKYKDLAGVGGPCKVVLIRGTIIKAVCKGLGVTIGAAPFTVSLGVNLSVGLLPPPPNFYCADFGLPFIINVPGLQKATNAPAPPACTI